MKSVVNASPRPLWKKLALIATICFGATLLLYLLCDLLFPTSSSQTASAELWTWAQTGPAQLSATVWEILSLLLLWEYTCGRTNLSRKGFALYWLIHLAIVALAAMIYLVANRLDILFLSLAILAGPAITLVIALVLMLLFRKKP